MRTGRVRSGQPGPEAGWPDLDARVRIPEALDVVIVSGDEVLVQHGSRSTPSELLRDTELTGLLARVFHPLLEGPVSVRDLVASLGPGEVAEAMALIADLLGRGFVTTTDRSPVEDYLGFAFGDASALDSRSVALVGAGPLGGRIARGLLQHGLGRLTLLDDREVDGVWHRLFERSPAAPAGASAGRALRDCLTAAGHAGVECLDARRDEAGIEAAVDGCDLVVVATERLELRLCHLVNRYALRARRPWLLAALDGDRGLVGPLFLPLQTACYNDYQTLADAATPNRDMGRAYRRHQLSRSSVSFALGLPAYGDLVAAYATLAVVHHLVRQRSFATGRVLTIDFGRMELDVEDVLKLPRCPACGRYGSAARAPFSGEVATRAEALARRQTAGAPESPAP